MTYKSKSNTEDEYRTLLESIAIGFCIIEVIFDDDDDPVDYHFLEVNPEFEDQTVTNDAEGKRMRRFAPDLEENWFQIFGEVVRTREPAHFSYSAEALNRFFDVYAFPFGEPEKRKVAVFSKDMTELMERQRDLEEYETIVETMRDGVYVLDADFHFTKVNDAYCELTGYSREELLGTHCTLVVDDEVSRESAARLLESAGEGSGATLEADLHRADGTTLRAESNFAPVFRDDPEHPRKIGVVRDVSERVVRERELEEYRRWTRTLMENFPAGAVALVDQEMRYITFGGKPEGDTNMTRKDLEGQYIRDVLPEQIAAVVVPAYEAALNGEVSAFEDTIDDRTYQFHFMPVRDDDGVFAATAMSQDITERKRWQKKLETMNETLEEQVEQRTKELRSLAAELSKAEEQERHRLAAELHDNLGQMLSVAKMNIDGLQMFNLHQSPAKVIAGLSEVINDAITYTRELMTELKPPPVLEKEEIRPAVDWVVDMMEERGFEVTIEDDKVPKPLSREVRTAIYQCLRELLLNVDKHAGVNRARVSLSRVDHNLKLTIEDQGKGFDTGEQVSNPTEKGGFGLLHIRERMKWFGGSFKISSEPGNGTKALLSVPLKEDKLGSSPTDAEELTLPRSYQYLQLEEIEILLVDDHKMMRNGLRQMIEKQEDMSIVAEAANGREAVDIVRTKRPNVVLMDVNMPEMDGIEATQVITEEEPDIIVIGLSLHNREEVINDMKNAGASSYLSKDEAFDTLCETIRRLFKEKKLIVSGPK